jgi:hypothetical protein
MAKRAKKTCHPTKHGTTSSAAGGEEMGKGFTACERERRFGDISVDTRALHEEEGSEGGDRFERRSKLGMPSERRTPVEDYGHDPSLGRVEGLKPEEMEITDSGLLAPKRKPPPEGGENR